jgi:hypothetical protein
MHGYRVDVSVIVVSFNTRDIVLECLHSLFEQTRGISFEVYLVDNASSDGTVEAVQHTFPHVWVIPNKRNVGFAAANNQGMREARGRYMLLLNPDTLVCDGAVQKTVLYADSCPSAAVIGCKVLINDREIQKTCFRFPDVINELISSLGINKVFPHSRFLSRPFMGDWDRRTERLVDVVSGMYMLVRREAINDVGLMDEDYFMFAEEADWCYRFWKHGWKCVFWPGTYIVHREGGSFSRRQVSRQMYVQLQKSILIFHRKHRSQASYYLVRTLYVISMSLRTGYWLLKKTLSPNGYVEHRLSCAWAALRYNLGWHLVV